MSEGANGEDGQAAVRGALGLKAAEKGADRGQTIRTRTSLTLFGESLP